MRLPFKHRGKNERGSVLIIVMVVCIGLVSVALVFSHAMEMAYRGSESDLAGRQANRAIDGAVQYAEYLMTVSGTTVSGSAASSSGTSSTSSSSTSGTSASNISGNLLPDPTTYQAEGVPVGDAMFWFIGEPTANTSSNNVPAFGLVDEASKINLNTASATMLQNLPNMTQSLAAAIVAWRTSSGTSSSSSTSSTSGGSSTVKGGPFESIYELAQIVQNDGDDPSILYGNDTNMNHVLDASEGQGGQFQPGLYEYVTVYSREPNTLSDGTKRIDITAPSQELRTLITTTFGDQRGRAITRAMDPGGPIKSVLEFAVRAQLTSDELDKIGPKLTMGTGTYKQGLINVNTASAAVLACVPGITSDKASSIVSARAGQSTPYTNLFFLIAILGRDACIQAGPYLTTNSFQVTADVAAVGENGRGYRRTLFVIDGSNGTPQVVYRRNMDGLGWALGPDAITNAQQQNNHGLQSSMNSSSSSSSNNR